MEPVIMTLSHTAQDVTSLYTEHPSLTSYEAEILKVTIELRNLKSRMIFALEKK